MTNTSKRREKIQNVTISIKS